MAIRFKSSLFVFRRDLRLEDNRAFMEACKHSLKVHAVFVVDERFNQQPSQRFFAKHFLYDRLQTLDQELKSYGGGLTILWGNPAEALASFVKDNPVEGVFLNHEYSPEGIQRDKHIQQALEHIPSDCWHFYHDALLFPPDMLLKSNGQPYRVFTPFYKRARTFMVETVHVLPKVLGLTKPKKANSLSMNSGKLSAFWQLGLGYEEAYYQLKVDKCGKYEEERDFPALDRTSHLSVYLKFGCISVRQAYKEITDLHGADSPLLRQLYWRDFFTQIAYHYPHVYQGSFNAKYDKLQWSNNREHFEAWCQGKTGFPIVDAGMRQLNETGYMHNRVRMITASFLVKDLHIDWRKGEKYFADKLADYDRALNNGNWQWAASTGCDAQPYFRIFNPWRQQERFDKDCEYIYKWLEELRPFTPKQIHHWMDSNDFDDYPKPIVEHSQQAAIIKDKFKHCAAAEAD